MSDHFAGIETLHSNPHIGIEVMDPDECFRVLVVDDEPFTLKALQRLLKPHHVDVACSGRDALLRFEEGARYDVILCDLMMPEFTGVDVYRTLAERHPGAEARIVFVSGGAFGSEILDFVADLPNPLVDKPFDRDELRDTVNRIGRKFAQASQE